MKKILVASVAAAAFCGAPVFAADLPVKAPVYKAAVPEFNWGGCYVGGHIGYVRSGYHDEFDTFIDYHGAIGGVLGGCNWQLPSRWVIGFEADDGWASTSKGNTNFIGPANAELNWLVTARARLGYAWDRVLIYGTGGAAWANQTFSNPGSSTATHDGWAAGAGLEMAVATNWIARIEYLRFDVGHKTYNIGLGPFDVSVKQGDIVRVGLTYKFGSDPWGKAPVSAKY